MVRCLTYQISGKDRLTEAHTETCIRFSANRLSSPFPSNLYSKFTIFFINYLIFLHQTFNPFYLRVLGCEARPIDNSLFWMLMNVQICTANIFFFFTHVIERWAFKMNYKLLQMTRFICVQIIRSPEKMSKFWWMA